jgi:hypothetical protein
MSSFESSGASDVMGEPIYIATENGTNILRLDVHPTGNGYVAVAMDSMGLPTPIDYFGLSKHDAIMHASRYVERNLHLKLSTPSMMFDWTLFRDDNGFFLCMPGNDFRNILVEHISADEGQAIAHRANFVRSYFGPRMNGCTLEQVWKLEAAMPVSARMPKKTKLKVA